MVAVHPSKDDAVQKAADEEIKEWAQEARGSGAVSQKVVAELIRLRHEMTASRIVLEHIAVTLGGPSKRK